MSREFNKALADFTLDLASGDAIRALTDKGYSSVEIYGKLDFPTPIEKIRKVMWDHLLDTNVVVFAKPEEGEMQKRIDYVKVQDKYGRTSFKQVIKEEKVITEYIEIDFGKRIYKDKKEFEDILNPLSNGDKDYALNLPWPIENVWHVKNERIQRIISC